jgi:ABC-2 type transport system ATP-binding protein
MRWKAWRIRARPRILPDLAMLMLEWREEQARRRAGPDSSESGPARRGREPGLTRTTRSGTVEQGIRTRGLRKVYKLAARRRRPPSNGLFPGGRAARPGPPPSATAKEIVALDALDLDIGLGEFFGLLGPNGAGKTTTIGILTTRIRPTAGNATVAGADVVRDPVGVKRRIGVVPQMPNPDRGLTVQENLIFHAAYFGITASLAKSKSSALLETLGLGERGGAKVNELSGGQQQRLMIARALIHEPDVIFLDEPTVGLDPQARIGLWDILRELHAQGRTIVMTTHYMEEADKLCDRVAIVDQGRLLALDSPAALKAKAPGGTLVEMVLDGDAAGVVDVIRTLPGISRAETERSILRVHVERVGETIAAIIRTVETAGLGLRDVHLAAPSLETLFISLTGRRLD